MATLPPEAATEPEFAEQLIAAGMDCARINCAHDDPEVWGQMIENVRRAEARLERPCRVLMDIAGPKCRILRVKAPPKTRLLRGDRIVLLDELREKTKEPIAFSLNFPELVDQLDDRRGTLHRRRQGGGPCGRQGRGPGEIEIYAAREKGVRLKPGKGVNFPSTELDLPPLTSKDFRDLDFIAEHADLIGYSFVQRVDDIELLQDHLVARAPKREPPGLVLKIETPLAVRNLPLLILQSAAHNPTAVMIARGDLAVELGFARLSEMQEEILWLCEAAHTPVVWATQVLDNYVRDGVASRAEMTDAAMAQGAECVMLNKGPYLAEGVGFLRDVLTRMDRHHAKKFDRFPSAQAMGLSATARAHWKPRGACDFGSAHQQVAEQLPALAVEFCELHLPDRAEIGRRRVDLHARQHHRQLEILDVGRLPHDVLAGEIVAALLEHLHHVRRGGERVSGVGVRELLLAHIFVAERLPLLEARRRPSSARRSGPCHSRR